MIGRYLKIVFLLLGGALFALVLVKTDTNLLLTQIANIGIGGALVILVVYILYFGADSLSWQVTIGGIPMNFKWFVRFYAVRMVGEAYNNITPVASMGGEPLKAWLLKSNWRIPLTDSSVGLVVSKTTSMFTLVVFVALGVALSFQHPGLDLEEKHRGAIGLSLIICFAYVFFLMQKLKFLSALSHFLARKVGKVSFKRVVSVAEMIDRQFETFYSFQKGRVLLSSFFAMLNWILGATEIYFIFLFLGDPLTFQEAWMLECFIQLVRTLTFFVPAGIGTQEGAFFLGAGMITGVSSIGVAAALVRRARDIFWISVSLAILSFFSVKPTSGELQNRDFRL